MPKTTTNNRLLITGGSSYLGQHLVPLAQQHYQVVYTYFQHDPLQNEAGRPLDIRTETAVANLVQSFRPAAIIHTVGSNRGPDMETVIRTGTGHITQAAQAVGARLIHLSTDSIFDGTAAPYDETALPTPVNAYGRAKAEAEAIVQTAADAVIVRTSLIYGLKKMGHSTRWMAKALQAGEPVTLFSNQIRNPIWVGTLCQAILALLAGDYQGTLHVAGRQALSRAEFSLKMLDYWQINERKQLKVSAYMGNEWPLNCELVVSKGEALLKMAFPGVDTILLNQSRQAP